MKTLQSDITTTEQSNRLLEIGVPKNSANHYYGKDGKLHYIDGTIPYSLLWESGCTPCWSAGRLMEIYGICMGVEGFFYCKGNFINEAIRRIEYSVKKNLLDFSKLED